MPGLYGRSYSTYHAYCPSRMRLLEEAPVMLLLRGDCRQQYVELTSALQQEGRDNYRQYFHLDKDVEMLSRQGVEQLGWWGLQKQFSRNEQQMK